ncbi:uncharacterized protein [Nicotiana sylvestris]|uniref:uncharacterized protein n=1 Tax=Nicotiana sylvestris TaxID=4096 RepID=UPI00388C61E9
MAELYPDDFDEFRMSALENQFASYIIFVHDFDEMFSYLNGLSDLSKILVKTKKHSVYPLVFLLVKLALLLPVATATIERAFSAMKFIKNDLRNRMDDDFLGGCIVPYVERKRTSPLPADYAFVRLSLQLQREAGPYSFYNCEDFFAFAK